MESINSASSKKLYPNYRYAQEINYIKEQNIFLTIDSNFGIQVLNSELKIIEDMQSYHKKKVNEVIYDEEDKMLISCSNDGTVRVKDLKSRTIIKEFKRKDEIYSISKSKHILCGGSEDGCITFWDLKTMKERQVFNESHQEDVTKVKFCEELPSFLMSCSTDGMLCLFDLEQSNEENSIYTMMRMEQPLNTCDFFQGKLNHAYASTTTGLIYALDLENSLILNSIQAIPNNEFNTTYLVDYQQLLSQYVVGDFNYQKGINNIQFFDIQNSNHEAKYKVDVLSQGRVSSLTSIDQNQVVITTDDGYIQTSKLVQSQQPKQNNANSFKQFQLEEEEMFEDLQETQTGKYKQRKNKQF